MRAAILILALGLAGLSAELWAPSLLENPAMLAFVLSSRFWPTAFGIAGVFAVFALASFAALVFHPDRLSGRTGPEGGE